MTDVTLQQAQAACDTVDAYLKQQAGLPPDPTPPDPTPPDPTPPDPTPPTDGKIVNITMDWNNPARKYTREHGGFGPNDVLVVAFTTGNVGTTNSLPRISAAEYDSSPSSRVWCLSDTAGSFDTPVGNAPGAKGESNSVTAIFAIAPGSTSYYAILKPNATYYVNIKNADNCTCRQNGVCEMFVDLIKPSGL